jgi:isopenicillin N synthase-like dioxygenase
MQLPTLSLQKWTHGSPEEQIAFSEELGSAFRSLGFAAIEDHGFGSADREQLYASVQQFFNLDKAAKRAFILEGAKGQRGFTPFGIEHAKGETSADLKEFFQWGPMNAEERGLSANVNVNSAVEGMDEVVRAAYLKLEAIGNELMKAVALHIGVNREYFTEPLAGGHSIFRAIHYPAQPELPEDGIRAAAHEDINLITLLMGASAEGLEVISEGKWVPIHVTNDALVINVGDMLQRLTNGVLSSTTHRVVNPTAEKRHLPRFSMPFFVHPKEDMPLNCMEHCISADRPKAFSDITAGAYLHERLVEIGLA